MATLTTSQVWFLAACAVFIAIGVTESMEGLVPLVKLAEVRSFLQSLPAAEFRLILCGKLSVTGIALYLLNQCFFKLSMAFFFLRISTRHLHRCIIKITVSVSIISNLILLAISIGQCGDINTVDLSQPHCLSWSIQGPLNYFCASLNALVDWLFASLAIYIVKSLVLDIEIRRHVYGIILLASIGSIVSVIRIPYISGLRLDRSYYSRENDVIAYTSLIESAVGIIAASMSVMRPLLARYSGEAKIVTPSTSSDAFTPRETLQSETSQTIELLVCDTRVKLFQAIPDLPPSIEAEAYHETTLDYVHSKLETIREENNTNWIQSIHPETPDSLFVVSRQQGHSRR